MILNNLLTVVLAKRTSVVTPLARSERSREHRADPQRGGTRREAYRPTPCLLAQAAARVSGRRSQRRDQWDEGTAERHAGWDDTTADRAGPRPLPRPGRSNPPRVDHPEPGDQRQRRHAVGGHLDDRNIQCVD